MQSLAEHRQVAVTLAYSAGRIIREGFTQNIQVQTKPDSSLVTNIDLQINTLVLKTLNIAYPHIPVIAEEQNSPASNTHEPLRWVCDPLDGTAAFAHGIPTCAFSLALTHEGNSVLGVAYDPFLDRMFVAEKGKGASLNTVPIHVSTEATLPNTMMGMSLWAGSKYNFLELIPKLKEMQAMPLNAFSTVYMGMLVASGHLSAAIYLDTYAHDVAALKVIVEEAGGKVTDLFGKSQRYDQTVQGCLLSNGILHEEYLGLLATAHLET